MTKETLHLMEPIEFKKFIELIEFSENNPIVSETDIGNSKEQIIPAIYFRQNEYYRIDFNSASSSYHLKLISTKNNIAIYIEFFNTIFIEHYDPRENQFSMLKYIARSALSGYENKGKIRFMGVNAKNSFKIMSGMKGAPVGGLITGAIFRGAFKLASKIEDDLVQTEGTLFSLNFFEGKVEREIDVIVESFYAETFEEFLKLNWSKTVPIIQKDEIHNTNEGCFIATACYKDYDHPVVLHLRSFRDDYLNDKKWGQAFIKFYYHHSQKYAHIISKNEFLKYSLKVFLIKPIYHITKILFRSK